MNATRDIDMAISSVRLSVRDTPVFYQNGKPVVQISSPSDSPIVLVVCDLISLRNFDGVTTTGASNTGEV